MDLLTTSINGICIRLPDERWQHITQRHAELLGQELLILDVIAHPERLLVGKSGELMAIRELQAGKWLVVIYRENQDDGFVITAFLTRRINSLNQRPQIWP